jgi:hypothetical protein
MKPTALALAGLLAAAVPSICPADDIVTADRFSGTEVSFAIKDSLSNVTLTIAGPEDFAATAFAPSGVPSIDLARVGPMADGLYHYQLTAATQEKVRSVAKLDNGRDDRGRIESRKGVVSSGTFWVKDGVIVKPSPKAQPRGDSARDRQD